MTKKTRRRYSAEFKAAAVTRLEESGETLSSVAQASGVAATQVKTWRLEQQGAGSAEAVARRRAEAAELQQMRRDNKRLQEENETLCKSWYSTCRALSDQVGAYGFRRLAWRGGAVKPCAFGAQGNRVKECVKWGKVLMILTHPTGPD